MKWGSDWLSSSEFEDRLRSSTEIAISFDGEFDYDEDQDDVHPKDFRKDFEISEDIALVLKHDGKIMSGTYRWPGPMSGDSAISKSPSLTHTCFTLRLATRLVASVLCFEPSSTLGVQNMPAALLAESLIISGYEVLHGVLPSQLFLDSPTPELAHAFPIVRMVQQP